MFFNHPCMNYLGLSHAPSFLFFSCNIWSSHNIQSFSYIYKYSAKAGNFSQSFILFLLLLLVGIHTPAKSVRTYLVPYGCYAFNLLVYSSCKWRLRIIIKLSQLCLIASATSWSCNLSIPLWIWRLHHVLACLLIFWCYQLSWTASNIDWHLDAVVETH